MFELVGMDSILLGLQTPLSFSMQLFGTLQTISVSMQVIFKGIFSALENILEKK